MSAARERRNRQNVYTLSGALLASFAVVFVTVLLAIRPEPSTRPEVDWHTVHASAPGSERLVSPDFTETDGDWWANRAEYTGGANARWVIGLVTPRADYVSIEQYVGELSSEIADVLDDVPGEPRTVAGTTWNLHDRSGLESPGNYELVFEYPLTDGGTLIVSGTAAEDEMTLAAKRALDSLKG